MLGWKLRILLVTFGSFGDLHPYIAIGLELRRRGHQVTIATSASYEAKVRSEGLEFEAARPNVVLSDAALQSHLMDAERATKYLAAASREMYQDTLALMKRADMVVTHMTAMGVVVAAEQSGAPWASAVVAPLSLPSVYDPPVPALATWMATIRPHTWTMRHLINLSKAHTARWVRPVFQLRKELGMKPGGHPLYEGQHSPRLVLALFSKCLAEPQRDWPEQTCVTGFPFYDRDHEQGSLPPELERYLADGTPPLIFSLGSTGVAQAGDFYRESLRAARCLDRRAVFLTGQHPQGLPADAMTIPYAPHSELFHRGAAIVHHGGIGTTAQAMRSGRPMLVAPFAHDQFDNGARVKRLGMGEVLHRSRYRAKSAEKALRRLLEDPRYQQAGAEIAATLRAENGARTAAEAIEQAAGL